MRKYKPLLIIFALLAIITIAVVVLYASGILKKDKNGSTEETANEATTIGSNITEEPPAVVVPEPEPEPEPEPFREYDIHIMAVGDNLFHTGVINGGQRDDGTYNYDFEFYGIADFLSLADIKIINQETPMAGNELGFSSYPTFNTPTQVGDAIANAGFNVVLGATNHATDKGVKGLISFYNYFNDNYPEILMCGIHGENIQSKLPNIVEGDEAVKYVIESDGTASDIDPEELATSVVLNDAYDYSRINLLNIQGFTFAVLNYTYGNNTEVYPSSQEGHLDLLTTFDPGNRYINFNQLNPQVIEDIQLAESIADIVIVCPHWGVEYTTKPTANQIAWAQEMTAAGADVIIGCHPHVVEPVEWVTADNGNEAICYYSLGNYVSTQNQAALNLLEAMAWVTFHVTEDGIAVSKDDTGVIPLVNHYTFNPLRYKYTYLLEDYTEELAIGHGILGWGGIQLHLDKLQSLSSEVLGDSVITRYDVYSQFDTSVINELGSDYSNQYVSGAAAGQ